MGTFRSYDGTRLAYHGPAGVNDEGRLHAASIAPVRTAVSCSVRSSNWTTS
ncbi:hypothetical protein [Lentzea sp. NPDC004782]|uniref:hypothetical protein n=1 Tax=Lentzea sp. NPDC004782 TaxID=3154458 RepID=UPI00339FF9BD